MADTDQLSGKKKVPTGEKKVPQVLVKLSPVISEVNRD
jgi:hypothetical protein